MPDADKRSPLPVFCLDLLTNIEPLTQPPGRFVHPGTRAVMLSGAAGATKPTAAASGANDASGAAAALTVALWLACGFVD